MPVTACVSGRRGSLVLSWLALVGVLAGAIPASAELPAEPVPRSVTVKVPYPPSYAVVHDFGFGSLIDSAFNLVDTSTRRFMGMMSAGQFATIDVSMRRQEFYVGETYHTRGSRGQRVDLVTVYDMVNLAPVAEIELPPKRANVVVNKGATAVTWDQRFMLVFNLNPATSVTVVDLERRTVAGEIATPGCGMVYPTTGRNFFMLCGDGSLLSVALAESGASATMERSAPFFDIDADPLSEKASRVGDTWQFISFKGMVQPIAAGGKPSVGDTWSLTSPDEREAGWRPAGWHWTAGLPSGELFVAMTPDGYDGSHKDPALEVWRFDTSERRRTGRIELAVPALSIDVTNEPTPSLLVVNVEGALDVYASDTGERLRTIYDLGASPYQVHRME